MRRKSGQAVLEFVLLVVMLAVTMAVVIRNTNFTIYCYWTGISNMVAIACPACKSQKKPPLAEQCISPPGN